ncbi:MAG: hypothetical protein GWN58_63110, partial [Anaerolineae bacterium]|nr:hypothetical protein [Anaerolineae bacterium]
MSAVADLIGLANSDRIESSSAWEWRMAIYVDVSSAVHAKAGIGRYAGSLAQALILRDPERFALFYNRTGSSLPPEGLESVPART